MDREDLIEMVFFGLFLAAIAVTYLMRFKYRNRVVGVERLAIAGSSVGIDVVVCAGPNNRRYIALE